MGLRVAAQDPEAARRSRVSAWRRRRDVTSWLAIATVVAWPTLETIRILVQPFHQVQFGDYALFELATRQAWHLDQLLGPPSTHGFHHPGPAMFYLLAPTVRLMQPGPGMHLGAVLINGAALVAMVVFVRRRVGSRAALWAACVLALFCLAVTLGTLREPWNSLLIILPMALFVVLWAGAMTGTPGAWLWTAVIGSFVVQTFAAPALFLMVMLVAASGRGLAAAMRRGPLVPPGWWRQASRMSGIVALGLIWAPPFVELYRNQPNNLDLMWDFMGTPYPRVPLGTAAGRVIRSIAVFPAHNPYSKGGWAELPVAQRREELVAGMVILLAGMLLAGWLGHRRQWFGFALACAPLVSVVMGTLAVGRAGAEPYAFITAWLAFVPYMILMAAGVALLSAGPPPTTTGREMVRAPRALAAAAVACCALLAFSTLRGVSLRDDRENTWTTSVSTLTGAALRELRPGDRRVGISIESGLAFTVAAGVVLELERLGYQAIVDQRYDFFFAQNEYLDSQPVQVRLSFYLNTDAAGAQSARGAVVAESSGTVMTSLREIG